jgi:hypothetical protein
MNWLLHGADDGSWPTVARLPRLRRGQPGRFPRETSCQGSWTNTSRWSEPNGRTLILLPGRHRHVDRRRWVLDHQVAIGSEAPCRAILIEPLPHYLGRGEAEGDINPAQSRRPAGRAGDLPAVRGHVRSKRPGWSTLMMTRGCQASRSPGRAINKVRVYHQHANRQGAGHRWAASIASDRRRGDRMNRRQFIAGLGSTAAWPVAA